MNLLNRTRPLRQRMLMSLVLSLLITASTAEAGIVGFEELTLTPNSFYNGGPTTNTNGWQALAGSDGSVHFGNSYDSRFGGFWNGFSYSNVVDTTTAGFGNQYAAYTGSGAGGSDIYSVGFSGSHAFINLEASQRILSVEITNTTYAALSMLNGDSFAKKFGGVSGNDPDFFHVTFTGYALPDENGAVTGTVDYYLADYRQDDNSLDYIVDQWQSVSLGNLGNARSIGISFQSSDVGQHGINTPTYVAMDNLTVMSVPEPTGFALLFLTGAMIRFRRRKPLSG